MKKLLMTVLMLVGVATFAGVKDPFVQFAESDFCGPKTEPHHLRDDQNWFGAQLISLQVKADTGVWLSNYVSSWHYTAEGGNEGNINLNGNIYNMSPSAFGYIYAKDIANLTMTRDDYKNAIHWSNGETTEITYYNDSNKNNTITTEGYFLGYFQNDAEIYLVMSTIPEDGSETVDSFQYVDYENNPEANVEDTTLRSRQHNYKNDIANNVRINFGINSETYGLLAREFVAVYTGNPEYSYKDKYGTSTGGPLPGVFFAGLLSLGTVFGASKAKRQKRA